LHAWDRIDRLEQSRLFHRILDVLIDEERVHFCCVFDDENF